MTENRENERNLIDHIPYLLLLAGAVVLMIRACFSFCYSDETFYFSTVHRFLQGDHPFVHEWFPTQMVSFILLPFQYAYRQVTGSDDGLILYFRILYVIYETAVAFFIYKVLSRSHRKISAFFSAVFFQYYTHLNIATLSYYTISVSMLLICLLLIQSGYREPDADARDPRERKASGRALVLSGSALALSVLSLPTLAAAYFIIVFLVLILSFIIRKEGRKLRRVLWLNFCGIVPVAAVVLISLLALTGVSGIADNLKYILSDEEHTMGLVYPFKNFFLSVFDVFGRGYVYLCLLLTLFGLVYSFREKLKRFLPFLTHPKVDPVHVKGAYVFLDLLLFCYAAEKNLWPHTGFLGTLICLFALPLFAATENENKQIKLFTTVFLGGFVFSMVFSYSSMCDLYVISIGHNLAAVAGIVFCIRFIEDMWLSSVKKNGMAEVYGLMILFTLVISLFTCISLRIRNVYRDAPLFALTARINSGVAKGLYTTPEHRAEYESLLSDIKEYTEDKETVLFTKLLPWGYMESRGECASYTTWRVPLSSERLKEYYEVYPEKIPDLVIVLNDDVGSYLSCGDVEEDPTPNENEREGYVWELISDTSYKEIPREYCTIYRRDSDP